MIQLRFPKCAFGLLTHDIYTDKDEYRASWYSNCDKCKYYYEKDNDIFIFTCVYGYLNSKGLK